MSWKQAGIMVLYSLFLISNEIVGWMFSDMSSFIVKYCVTCFLFYLFIMEQVCYLRAMI